MNEFYKLNDRDDAQAQTHSDAVFHQIKVCQLEGVAQEVDLNDGGR